MASRNRTGLVLGVAFAVVVLVGVGAYLAFLGRGGADPEGTRRVTGRVKSTMALGQHPVVVLDLGGGNEATCAFAAGAVPPGFDALRDGTRATIRGWVRTDSYGYMWLEGCDIISTR